MSLQAPFPYFGGKSKAASLIWARFGDVQNYVEPFAGSLAVLLARPHAPKTETVNDLDGFISNFWRATTFAPLEVVQHADWPVNENDLTARHLYLVERRDDLSARLEADPYFFDAQIAGWWVWGQCCWIGSGWCSGKGSWTAIDGKLVKVERTEAAADSRRLPHMGDAGKGVNRKRPHLANGGRGIQRQLPHLSHAGTGVSRSSINDGLEQWFADLSHRMRRVRVATGRVL